MFDFASLFRRERADRQAVHLSFAKSRVGRTISQTGLLLKKQLWVFPVAAVVVLLIVHFFVRRSIENTMKANLASQLQTLLNTESAMLETWLQVQESNATTLAADQRIRDDVYKLLEASETTALEKPSLVDSPLRASLTKSLMPSLSAHHYEGFIVLDRSRRVLASDQRELVDREYEPSQITRVFDRVIDGETTVTVPYPSQGAIRNDSGGARIGVPTMFVLAPVRDAAFQTVAVLGLRIRPDRDFTRVLQIGRIGETGETYAFDRDGQLVSNSRFDEELILLGLIPDREDARSILNIQLRNPGGDMTKGFRPAKRRSELPFTPMVEAAVAGQPGVNVEDATDYRGVPVTAAWTWLPRYGLGITTKLDAAEAFRPLTILQRTFRALLSLVVLAAIAIFIFSVMLARSQREARKAAIASKKLGQYTLDTKLGAGAMGVVYKGHHAVLRRSTAIKLLNVDKVNASSIERFEREVQTTSQLNHPNTVAIYDYGRTEEGVFYYAMEFIEGIDLQALVEKYGRQSEARTIHILRQVCGSLYEAHSLGLVHRDIKPANIMLARRGGEPDVVKVLDFGLVKAIDDKQQASMTVANSLTGTPMYMSPEAIQTPNAIDPRSDLYAVGAVGYFLLTGKSVFDAENIVELCQAHVSKTPVPPSERAGRAVSAELEGAILACLDKSRAKRPQTARDLAQLLSRSPAALQWSIEEADQWWGRHERGVSVIEPESPPRGSEVQTLPVPDTKTNADFGQTYVTHQN
jgi:serine/threonine protein kinase